MFWIGFGVGRFVGAAMGVFVMALCIIGSRGDNNGNSKY